MKRDPERNLYIMAFDHRESFKEKLFGSRGGISHEQHERATQLKLVIYDGFLRVLREEAPARSLGILVDEEFGSAIVRRARSDGVLFSVPVEKSGQVEFQFEFGDHFTDHIASIAPTFVKALVRYNPEGNGALNDRQSARLVWLSDWLADRETGFMFELLVPPEPDQLAAVAGDRQRYDREMRSELMVRAIHELHAARVEPDVWKIEGLDRRRDCAAVARAVRTGGRDDVTCIMLGRGADADAVDHWLRQAAGIKGFCGFAIGRTVWGDEIQALLAGSIGREEAVSGISRNYRYFIEVYEKAARNGED